MSLHTKCTFYKGITKENFCGGKIVSIYDLLTNERYTNPILNDIRLSGYKSEYYNETKKLLSAAAYSSVQDDLTCHRTDANHLFHTGYIAFDIDIDANPYLNTDPEGLKEFIIDNIPFVAYIGKSVSNIGLWGLIPILNKEDHYGHYEAMKELFKAHDITLDHTSDISRLRFVAYDPDGYINDEAKIFMESKQPEQSGKVIDYYERSDVNDEFFIAACHWIEAKHGIKFQKGSIHNYLLYLYGLLRSAHVSREKCLNWIYNNLIDEREITTNCLDEPKWLFAKSTN